MEGRTEGVIKVNRLTTREKNRVEIDEEFSLFHQKEKSFADTCDVLSRKLALFRDASAAMKGMDLEKFGLKASFSTVSEEELKTKKRDRNKRRQDKRKDQKEDEPEDPTKKPVVENENSSSSDENDEDTGNAKRHRN